MKKLLFSLSVMIFGFALVTGCKQDPNSSANNLMPMKTTPPPADAHPALAYYGTTVSHNTTYSTIAVMDTDGTDQTNIYTAGISFSLALSAGGNRPSWSAAGDKICFAERTSQSNPFSYVIKKVDVSVVSGVAHGSNVTTLYTSNTSDSIGIYSQVYSSLSTTGKIAFEVHRGTAASTKYAKLFTISTSGGTPTLLYQSTDGLTHSFNEINWSPDDSKIAFIDNTGVPHQGLIRIIDASTGVQTDSIAPGYFNINSLEWSRSGLNKLAFCTNDTDVGLHRNRFRRTASVCRSYFRINSNG